MSRPSWDQRIARAGELATIFPFAAEVLAFYTTVTRFQRALYGYVCQARGKSLLARGFRDGLDLPLLMPRFPGFLKAVATGAPRPLSFLAKEMFTKDEPHWEELLCNFWQRTEPEALQSAEAFFARAFLQPYAEFVADRLPELPRHGNTATCPLCDSEPVVGVLREVQLGAGRSLICSLCSYEWEFPRALCPGCGEDRNDVLAVFTSEQFPHVRVEVCDTCKCYLKTVDLTKNGLAVAQVDELATLPLNVWAQAHGYAKLQPNLLAV
jgi:formate dehydrogenase maturation protein FdhE